jgi:hypothetical protein
MTDCVNETMRDLLPLLAHDALSAGEVAQVRAHIAECASCAAELAVLGQALAVFEAATPKVDTAAILAKLPQPGAHASTATSAATSPSPRPVLTVSRPARRAFGLPRYALAAAASLVLVATLSLAVLGPAFLGVGPVGVDVVRVESGSAGALTIPVGLLGGSDLGDLSADELSALLQELDQMEATVDAEPITMRQPLGPELEGI